MTKPIVIVGGGISGLTLAFRLQQAGAPFLLLEASQKLGGNIQTAKRDGFLYDLGPDAFLKTKPAAAALCRELGLEQELIAPSESGRKVFVAHRGRLLPMPEGLSLGVPKRPGPILKSPLLSWGAKMRALMEPWVPARRGDDEESIAAFMRRRLGAEMADRLAAPLLAGVYAGDAEKLSMDAAFPQLLAFEQRFGSLFSGMMGGKSVWKVLREAPTPAVSPFLSLKRGLGSLIDALEAKISPQSIRRGAAVSAVLQYEEGARVVLENGEQLQASQVVLAGAPWLAAPLLKQNYERLGETLAGVNGFETATIFFAFPDEGLAQCPEGSGFIVPPGEGEILAGTFVNSKWSERAPAGFTLMRAFMGGARFDISPLSDDELVKISLSELTRLLGQLGTPTFSQVHRYRRGTPQPELGYEKRLQIIKSEVAHHKWLSLIGPGYGSVGIPDCIEQANQLARELLGA